MTVKAERKADSLERKLTAMYPQLDVRVYVEGHSIVLSVRGVVGDEVLGFTEYVGDRTPNAQIIAENRDYFTDLAYDVDAKASA